MRWDTRNALFVDTNLLVLLVIGAVDPLQIGRAGRVRGYTEDDYDQLRRLASGFRVTVSTPHVLSELSNLARQGFFGEHARQIRAVMKSICIVADERFVPARCLLRDDQASWLGLADMGILEAASRGCTVVTDDLPLYNQLRSRGLQALNFTHLRFPEHTIEV